jgi:hypothetical protein
VDNGFALHRLEFQLASIFSSAAAVVSQHYTTNALLLSARHIDTNAQQQACLSSQRQPGKIEGNKIQWLDAMVVIEVPPLRVHKCLVRFRDGCPPRFSIWIIRPLLWVMLQCEFPVCSAGHQLRLSAVSLYNLLLAYVLE